MGQETWRLHAWIFSASPSTTSPWAALRSTEHSDFRLLTSDFSHIAAAVDGLRRAGQQHYLPLGLRNRAGHGTEVLYARGCGISGGTNEDDSIAQAAALARRADVAVVYVGTNNKIESEGRDRTSLSLPGRQEDLVKAVCAANPKAVVVLMNAGPLTVPRAQRKRAGHPGGPVDWRGGRRRDCRRALRRR